MNDVHNALRSMYPEDYRDVYGDIKPIIRKYVTVQQSAVQRGTLTAEQLRKINGQGYYGNIEIL